MVINAVGKWCPHFHLTKEEVSKSVKIADRTLMTIDLFFLYKFFFSIMTVATLL